MADIFCDRTYPRAEPVDRIYERTPYMRTALDQTDLFYNQRDVPGSRKYPMDVANLDRPRRGHGY
jgi:hypothetical protein